MKSVIKKIFRGPGIILSLILLLGVAAAGLNCISSKFIPEKMDPALQQKIKEAEEKKNNDEIIQFAGKTSREIDAEMKTKLESTGIKTESIIQDIFTASGNPESIKKTTLIDFVVYLEKSKNLDLK